MIANDSAQLLNKDFYHTAAGSCPKRKATEAQPTDVVVKRTLRSSRKLRMASTSQSRANPPTRVLSLALYVSTSDMQSLRPRTNPSHSWKRRRQTKPMVYKPSMFPSFAISQIVRDTTCSTLSRTALSVEETSHKSRKRERKSGRRKQIPIQWNLLPMRLKPRLLLSPDVHRKQYPRRC